MIIGASVFQTMGLMGGLEGTDQFMTRNSFLDSVNQIFDLGYQQIELPADHLLMALDQTELILLMQDLKILGEKYGAKWAVHLPFLWINGSALDDNIREGSARTHLNFIELTSVLEPTHYVLHSITDIGRLRNVAVTQIREELMQRVINSAKRTADELISAIGDPSRLCIENLTNVDFQWDLRIIKELGASICLDIGHHFHRGGDVLTFLEDHLSLIKCIHAHNIIPKISVANAANWTLVDHAPLGEGLIDDVKIVQWLIENEYSGSFIAEVRGGLSEGVKTIKFLQELGAI